MSTFVEFWYNLSDPLYIPFDGTVEDLSSGNIIFEINSLIAIIIYSVIALAVLNIIIGVLEDKVSNKVKRIIETGFKIIESILALRLVFKLIGAGKSGFITLLYAISSPVYEPFKGILPSFGHDNIIFETATFIALIIIIIVDFASDKLLIEIFKEGSKNSLNTQRGEQIIQPNNNISPQSTNTQPSRSDLQQQDNPNNSNSTAPTINVYNNTQDQQETENRTKNK